MTADSPAEPQFARKPESSPAIGWLLAALLVTLAAVEHYLYARSNGEVLREGGLVDPDSYMRVMRIMDLVNGGGWYDTVTQKVGAPEGLSLHWTRPVDILILVPALIAHLFGAGMSRAVYWIGAAFSPVCHILACLAAAWAARPLWPSPGHRFAALILLTNAAAFGYGVFGRADHHTLLLLLTALMIGAALRAAIAGIPARAQRRWAAWSGVFAGLGVWVSPELLVPITPVILTFGLFWVDAPTDAPSESTAPPRDWAALGAAFSLAMAVVMLIAVPVEQPPAHWLAAEYDKVSIPYLVLPLIWAAVFLLARRIRGGIAWRIGGGLVLGAIGLGILLGLFPNLLLGPLGVDTRLKTDFLDTVREMQPLWPTSISRLRNFLPMLGQSVAALVLLPFAFRRWRGERRWAGFMIALVFGFLLIAAMMHARLGVEFAPAPAVICAGFFHLAERRMKGRSRLLRTPALVLVAVALTVGPLLVGLAFPAPPDDPGTCKVRGLADWMNRAHPGKATADGRAPIVMTDDYSYGPELAFRTGYRVVAGPYHRNPQAIFDTIDTMRDKTGARAKAIADKRQISLYIRCTDVIIPKIYDSSGNFYSSLAGQTPLPGWLTRLTLPPDLAGHFKVYEVNGR